MNNSIITKTSEYFKKRNIVLPTISELSNPHLIDESIRKKSISLHQDAIKVASYLECKALLFVPGVVKSPISPEIVRYDRALERLREAINQMLPIAEDLTNGLSDCIISKNRPNIDISKFTWESVRKIYNDEYKKAIL